MCFRQSGSGSPSLDFNSTQTFFTKSYVYTNILMLLVLYTNTYVDASNCLKIDIRKWSASKFILAIRLISISPFFSVHF